MQLQLPVLVALASVFSGVHSTAPEQTVDTSRYDRILASLDGHEPWNPLERVVRERPRNSFLRRDFFREALRAMYERRKTSRGLSDGFYGDSGSPSHLEKDVFDLRRQNSQTSSTQSAPFSQTKPQTQPPEMHDPQLRLHNKGLSDLLKAKSDPLGQPRILLHSESLRPVDPIDRYRVSRRFKSARGT